MQGGRGAAPARAHSKTLGSGTRATAFAAIGVFASAARNGAYGLPSFTVT